MKACGLSTTPPVITQASRTDRADQPKKPAGLLSTPSFGGAATCRPVPASSQAIASSHAGRAQPQHCWLDPILLGMIEGCGKPARHKEICLVGAGLYKTIEFPTGIRARPQYCCGARSLWELAPACDEASTSLRKTWNLTRSAFFSSARYCAALVSSAENARLASSTASAISCAALLDSAR